MSCFINQKLESIASRKCSLELQNVNAYFVGLWKILDNMFLILFTFPYRHKY